jgi:hypothetical protein
LSRYEWKEGDLRAEIVLDPTLVRLQSAAGKFLVVAVTIQNNAKVPFVLSSDDTLTFTDSGGEMTGSFVIDKIDQDVARRLKENGMERDFDYPAHVDAAKGPDEEDRPRPTEVTVFAILKVDRVMKQLPTEFTYRAAGKVISLRHRQAMAS